MTRVGYARVSTSEQDLALQYDALVAAKCDRIFEDRASGAKTDRPGLSEALAYLRDGDTLVVWKLDSNYPPPPCHGRGSLNPWRDGPQ